jgi:hypothetical protein
MSILSHGFLFYNILYKNCTRSKNPICDTNRRTGPPSSPLDRALELLSWSAVKSANWKSNWDLRSTAQTNEGWDAGIFFKHVVWYQTLTRTEYARNFFILSLTLLLYKPIGASPRRDYVVTRMVLVRILFSTYSIMVGNDTSKKGGERSAGYGLKEKF